MKCALTSTLSRTVTVALTSDSAADGDLSTLWLAIITDWRIPSFMFGLLATQYLKQGSLQNPDFEFRNKEFHLPQVGIFALQPGRNLGF